MKKLNLLVLTAAFATTASAQLNGDGYYRVQSSLQQRYISVVDDYGKIDLSTTTADLAALRTVLGFERVVSDASSIIYIKQMGGGYDLQSQGTGSYAIINYAIQIQNLGDGNYWASASRSGLTKYLMDKIVDPRLTPEDEKIIGGVTTIGTPSDKADWKIIPVTTANNYFGLTPNVSVGANYYQLFYAAFPFTFSSTGMNAYTVTKVDKEHSAVVIEELTNGVPASTPVIVKCSSSDPANNKLNVGASASSSASGNLLKGVYFCNDVTDQLHRDVVAYDAATMRVLGKASDGSLAFIKDASLKNIPANSAYITVSTDTPAELKVYTQAEYDDMFQAVAVQVTVNDATRKYGEANPELTYTVTPSDIDLTGKVTLSCDADAKSGVGEYAITATVTPVEGLNVTCKNGTLTVTPAQLTATAANAERVYGEENPTFTVSYAGFVNGETEAVLTEKPTVTTEATKTSAAGTYPITVTGGQAANYVLNAVNGTLTVNKAQLTATAANAERVYGEENPTFTVSYTGFVNGETDAVLTEKPTATTEATKTSAVGTYPITVKGGQAANYVLNAVNGTLTVTKAQLTATVADAERVYGEENPTFTVSYTGFVNNETDAALTEKPTVTTEATKASAVGTYPITVKGGQAANYDLTTVDGTLTVTKALLKVTANDVTRNEGEANPVLTVSYEGFVNDEDETVLTVAPTATTTATVESEAGTYEITVSGGEAANYEFEYKSGTLTILAVDGIDTILVDGRTLGNVYDLKGRLVRSAGTSLEGLTKGVYVVSGRKVVLK